jgi:amidase
MFEYAFEQAVEKDRQIDEAILNGTAHSLPPLHGIPISIKEHASFVGTRWTMGCDFLVHEIATSNATVVDLLIRAGAIPYVKGNLP